MKTLDTEPEKYFVKILPNKASGNKHSLLGIALVNSSTTKETSVVLEVRSKKTIVVPSEYIVPTSEELDPELFV
jgi:hypothetical protein